MNAARKDLPSYQLKRKIDVCIQIYVQFINIVYYIPFAQSDSLIYSYQTAPSCIVTRDRFERKGADINHVLLKDAHTTCWPALHVAPPSIHTEMNSYCAPNTITSLLWSSFLMQSICMPVFIIQHSHFNPLSSLFLLRYFIVQSLFIVFFAVLLTLFGSGRNPLLYGLLLAPQLI